MHSIEIYISTCSRSRFCFHCFDVQSSLYYVHQFETVRATISVVAVYDAKRMSEYECAWMSECVLCVSISFYYVCSNSCSFAFDCLHLVSYLLYFT